MRRIRTSLPVSRTTLPGLFVILAMLLPAAPAGAVDTFTKIFLDYQRTGKIDGCKYSPSQLSKAKKQVPNDIEQYAPDFPAALQAAIESRASGKCRKGAKTTPAPATTTPAAATPGTPLVPAGPTGATGQAAPAPAAAAPTPQPTPDPKLAPAAADNAILVAGTGNSGSDAPAPLVLLAIFAGILALAALAWGIARWWAWEPHWALRARHAGAEAGWRASGAWAEFTDWLRLGR